jgi:endonuclease III-like uncharacterized protein
LLGTLSKVIVIEAPACIELEEFELLEIIKNSALYNTKSKKILIKVNPAPDRNVC